MVCDLVIVLPSKPVILGTRALLYKCEIYFFLVISSLLQLYRPLFVTTREAGIGTMELHLGVYASSDCSLLCILSP